MVQVLWLPRVALALLLFLSLTIHAEAAGPYGDRFVWIFGWDLDKDSDTAQITRLLETAAQHGFNGAVLSAGLDTLSKQSPDYFRRLAQIQQACEQNHLELIPAVFSVGYDADDLNDVKAWLQAARDVPLMDGFMYTPWEKKYSLLPAFGDLLKQP